MFTKARIKLNLKKLYAADGHAVKEMLKVATLLYEAARQAEASSSSSGPGGIDGDGGDDSGTTNTHHGGDVMSLSAAKVQQLKEARTLTQEITQIGARLFDMLGRYEDLRGSWMQATELDTQTVADQVSYFYFLRGYTVSALDGHLWYIPDVCR